MQRFGRVFPAAEREIFKMGFCRRYIPEGRERQVIGRGRDRSCERRVEGVRRERQ